MVKKLGLLIFCDVPASASVEVRSMEAASDSTALYFAAKSTTTVANGKLQQTSASRANGLTTCRTTCDALAQPMKANRAALDAAGVQDAGVFLGGHVPTVPEVPA
jgi:hypothetical protein